MRTTVGVCVSCILLVLACSSESPEKIAGSPDGGTGASKGSGGRPGSGGAGGTSGASGGRASGGASASGGRITTGGTSASGGTAPSSGGAATGGTPASGGAPASGGGTATGGTPPAGDAGPSSPCARLAECCVTVQPPVLRPSCNQNASDGNDVQCSVLLGTYCNGQDGGAVPPDAPLGGCDALSACCPSLGPQRLSCEQLVSTGVPGACDVFRASFCPP